MKLWLDDIRRPWEHGCSGWDWAKTADEAIAMLKTGRVTIASLDHDLSDAAMMGQPAPNERTGYTVVCFMEENNIWPEEGVYVHSLNPVGRRRIQEVVFKQYGRSFAW